MKIIFAFAFAFSLSFACQANARSIYNEMKIRIESADGRIDPSQTIAFYEVRCSYFVQGEEPSHASQRGCGHKSIQLNADQNGVITLPEVEKFSILKNGLNALLEENYSSFIFLKNGGLDLGKIYNPKQFQKNGMAVLHVYKLNAKIDVSHEGTDFFNSKFTQVPYASLYFGLLDNDTLKLPRAFFAANYNNIEEDRKLNQLTTMDIRDMMYITFDKNKPMAVQVKYQGATNKLSSEVLYIMPSELDRMNVIEINKE